ncbi:MAG: TonB-dependent receptor [Candidatus Saccharibacteria bacterium]|nr:TonB-dependent receptor [Rhodoferax sp.]
MAAPAWNNRDVEAYSIWDLTGNFKFSKALVVRGGILNVMNTMPPFTNQTRYFQTSWDPTYADPRGRSYYISANYSFK